jgi:hypothetical protein
MSEVKVKKHSKKGKRKRGEDTKDASPDNVAKMLKPEFDLLKFIESTPPPPSSVRCHHCDTLHHSTCSDYCNGPVCPCDPPEQWYKKIGQFRYAGYFYYCYSDGCETARGLKTAELRKEDGDTPPDAKYDGKEMSSDAKTKLMAPSKPVPLSLWSPRLRFTVNINVPRSDLRSTANRLWRPKDYRERDRLWLACLFHCELKSNQELLVGGSHEGGLLSADYTKEIRFTESRDSHISMEMYVKCGAWTLEELLDLRNTFRRFVARPFHQGDGEICVAGTVLFD